MSLHPATPGSVQAFLAILVAVVVALLWAIHRAYRTPRAVSLTLLVLGSWLGVITLLVWNGRIYSLPLHGLPFFFGSVLLIAVGFALSPVGARLAASTPLVALVGFQSFRLPLELVLHAWAEQGVIPETMTWTGQNWDILSGLTALVCLPLVERHPVAARIANIVGLALLLNVMRVAVLSSPLPFGWGVKPPLALAFHLPYAFIGPVCVGGALFGHLVLTRALWRPREPD